MDEDPVTSQQGGEHAFALEQGAVAINAADAARRAVVFQDGHGRAAGDRLRERGFGALNELGAPVLAVHVNHARVAVEDRGAVAALELTGGPGSAQSPEFFGADRDDDASFEDHPEFGSELVASVKAASPTQPMKPATKSPPLNATQRVLIGWNTMLEGKL